MAQDEVSVVLKATKREDVTGIEMGGKEMRFGRSGGFTVSDPAIARDIEQAHGARYTGEVVVFKQPRREPGHRYTFGQMPEMPWKRKAKEQEDESGHQADL